MWQSLKLKPLNELLGLKENKRTDAYEINYFGDKLYAWDRSII